MATNSRLVFRRETEAMKLFNFKNRVNGKGIECDLSFDGTKVCFADRIEGTLFQRVHIIMMDEEKNIKQWHGKEEDFSRIESPIHLPESLNKDIIIILRLFLLYSAHTEMVVMLEV